jgi:hypothetical protein
MSQIVKAAKPVTSGSRSRESQVLDPFAELNNFFDSDPLSRTECPNIIAWYGVSQIAHFQAVGQFCLPYCLYILSLCS